MRKPFGKSLGPVTDHFDGTVFRNQNPAATAGRGLRRFPALATHETCNPVAAVGRQPRAAGATGVARCGAMRTHVHQSHHVPAAVPGLNVLTDPVYSERVSPVQWLGPRRVHAPGLAFEALPRIDLVLVSHNHYDHLDLDTLQRLEQQHHPLFLTGLGNGSLLQQHGLARVQEFDWWQDTAQPGLRCTFVPAQHWSARSLRRS